MIKAKKSIYPFEERYPDLSEMIFEHNNLRKLQLAAAPKLRALAIEELRHGETVTAKGFNGAYSEAEKQSTDSFLKKQSKNGVWGTYIEASALAAALKVNAIVTYKDDYGKEHTWALHKENDEAPIVHLYNTRNCHWESVNNNSSSTIADGNCLYNAFALELQHIAQPYNLIETDSSEIMRIVEIQKQVLKQCKSTEDSATEILIEQQRITNLSEETQKQISDDRALALKIAGGDVNAGFDSPSLEPKAPWRTPTLGY